MLFTGALGSILSSMTDVTKKTERFIIRALNADDIDQCFALATQVFVEGSTLHRALNIGLNEYRDYLWPSFQTMVRDGLSVVATDRISHRVLGCLIVTRFDPSGSSDIPKNEKFAPLQALTSELVRRYRAKRELTAGDAVLVDMGAVAPEATGMGVYKAMRFRANQIAQDCGFRFILGELSSAATQQVVLDQMGHRNMAEVSFAAFEHAGTHPFSSITSPSRIVLSEGDLLEAN